LDKNKLDKKKIKSSIKANYIHTIDAALLRWVLSQEKIYGVHDCFFIDYIKYL
jgi:DNA-directed RNA polymerase